MEKPLILIAEDDEDDFLLFKDCLEEAGISNELLWFKNGEEIITFLNANEAKGIDKRNIAIIFLDINMPLKTGLEVLKEIKGHDNLRVIPTLVLTTSGNALDIQTAYHSGANSFIKKPLMFAEYLKAVHSLRQYWFESVKLPIR